MTFQNFVKKYSFNLIKKFKATTLKVIILIHIMLAYNMNVPINTPR